MYPTQEEHYFLLKEKEWEVIADCGCQIAVEEDTGIVRFSNVRCTRPLRSSWRRPRVQWSS